MPDLLLELRSEEIPARMQRKAAGDLNKLVTDGLVEAGLTYEAARNYWTPRRLTLDIRGLTARSRDIREERKGPSVSAPGQAIDGFLRAAGLSDISQAQVQSDPKKGDFYVAVISKPGRAADAIIADLIPGIIRSFPWPKSMRSGAASAKPGSLRWVRPLQSIVCLLNTEPEEPVVVNFEMDGIKSGNVTYGHRFHAPEAITVRRFEDYMMQLERAKVVLDAERRKEIILTDARNLCFAQGLELIEDEGLLEEVSGLVEWPVVLMGEFEADYLTIPAEVIRLTIKTNQKCFVTRRPDGELSNKFILVANIEAKDGGAEIARGNGKVVRARLSDALYFWKTDQGNVPDLKDLAASAEKFGLDLSKPLDQRMARLDHLNVTFHAKLGTQGERVARIAKLAEELAPIVGADAGQARRAAILAKADLQTEVVGEFPELQGLIGCKYAALQGENPSVCAAIEDHWKPQGPADRAPSDPVAIAVALADKLDTLVGFWAIDEKPTGSKDPYALRRAALGMIRIMLERGVRLGLSEVFKGALNLLPQKLRLEEEREAISAQRKQLLDRVAAIEEHTRSPIFATKGAALAENSQLQSGLLVLELRDQSINSELAELSDRIFAVDIGTLGFFHDRLKVYLRDQGARHDLIDAVLASGAGAFPLAGKVSAVLTDGGGAGNVSGDEPVPQPHSAGSASSSPPPSVASGDTSPARGEAGLGANDDLLAIARRVEALTAFINTADGQNLVAGYKRAANILVAEEKKGAVVGHVIDATLFSAAEETALFEQLNQSANAAGQAIEKEDYSGAMQALSALREPVDSFFEKVLVNDPDEKVRLNRLALLSEMRKATARVADFSKISG